MNTVFGNLDVAQFEAIARARESEGKPMHEPRYMLDEFANLSNLAPVCVVITYEDVRVDEYEVTMSLPDGANIDEAVHRWMERYMSKIHQYAWQRASECGLSGCSTDVVLNT